MTDINVYELWDKCKEKPCKRCGAIKPASAFYVRSGIENPTEYGHYVSECKDCMLERGKGQKKLPRGISRVESENMAIEYLAGDGIPAVPGKACMMPDTDICAKLTVGIEVKLGTWSHQGNQEICSFTTTPKQQKRGFLAHLVMLIVPRGDEFSYHLFPASHPIFYKDGKIKQGWTYVQDRYEAERHSQYYVVLTEDMMQDAEGATDLIRHMDELICKRMIEGKRLSELLPRVYQPDWTLVDHMPELYG